MDETLNTQHVVCTFDVVFFSFYQNHILGEEKGEIEGHTRFHKKYTHNTTRRIRTHSRTHFIKHLSWRNFAHSLCASIGDFFLCCCYSWIRIYTFYTQLFLLTPNSSSVDALAYSPIYCIFQQNDAFVDRLKCRYFAILFEVVVRMCLPKRLHILAPALISIKFNRCVGFVIRHKSR